MYTDGKCLVRHRLTWKGSEHNLRLLQIDDKPKSRALSVDESQEILNIFFSQSNEICIVSTKLSKKDLESLSSYVEASEIKNFSSGSELKVDAEVTVLKSIRESYGNIDFKKCRGSNITLFNPVKPILSSFYL